MYANRLHTGDSVKCNFILAICELQNRHFFLLKVALSNASIIIS